ncbi:MAG TPA: lipid-A-disaccharide synthase [Methylomirabilota bacterium]|nr:lipid-A-disaccharide synthase [Methylomirabilota bacterium]
MLVVGEASGDMHGAQLVEALHARDETIRVFGVAGERLERMNFEALFHVAQLTGMGLVELAGNLKNIWRAYARLKRALKERRPALLVLIDFPEFNLRLARLAKSLKIPVLYYVSPQIWAWRKGRVRQIARWVDRMAVVFPFEVPFYERYGVKVTFVGHPLLETVRSHEPRETVLARLGLDPAKPTIALLPGSRLGEVERHLPVMREAALHLRQEREVQFFCVRASTIERPVVESALRGPAPAIPVVEAAHYDAIGAADLVWTASGTATLETALLGKPMIIIYRLSWLTYLLARLLVRVEHIGMVNLIAQERIVPELIQKDANPQRLVAESRRLLDDAKLRARIAEKLTEVRGRLGSPGAAGRVAELAIGMIASKAVRK